MEFVYGGFFVKKELSDVFFASLFCCGFLDWSFVVVVFVVAVRLHLKKSPAGSQFQIFRQKIDLFSRSEKIE